MVSRKIVIVDDNREFLDECKEMFFLNGYDAIGIHDGNTALKVIPLIKPDIVLLDLKMREPNGFEAAQRLRRIPESASIPIIAMTGCYTQDEHALAVKMFGMQGYLKKPLQALDVIKEIERVLCEREESILSGVDILVIEDDTIMQQEICEVLAQEGYRAKGVCDLVSARRELRYKFYNIALLDLRLPDGSGINLLTDIKRINQETEVIIITAWPSVDNSVSSLNGGACAYLRKPYNMDELNMAVKKAIRAQRASIENRFLVNRLQELSVTDTLTGIYNYRYLIDRLNRELQRARRYLFPLSVAMLDIDYFKSINDVYGHQYGDKILKEFALFLKGFVRGYDIVARYGGEEFAVILPDTDKDNALILAERLLKQIEQHTFDAGEKKIKIQISIGLFGFPDGSGRINNALDLLSFADVALLNAKESGRARVSVYKSERGIINGITHAAISGDISNVREKLMLMEKSVSQTLFESVYAFAKSIYAKDYNSSEYAENMVSVVLDIGRRMQLCNKEMEVLKQAVLLHDVGKIGIPDEILLKQDKVSKEEYDIIKKHPQIGVEIIRPINFLRDLIPLIFYHHERFDGSGYSAGLKGREIPLGARIIALVDTYQALVSDRPYRKAYNKEQAVKIIKDASGSQFDPEVVEAFLGAD